MTPIAAVTAFALALASSAPVAISQEKRTMDIREPEQLYRGDLVSFPGPWAFQIGRAHVILVSDQDLKDLSDPDRVLNLSLTFDKQEASLRQLCERAQAAGHRTLILAFDHFFSQYRPGQNRPRELTPDMDEYIERIAAISKFAQQYGIGLELSLLSPLELGPAYSKQSGQSGIWLQYRKGYRDPTTGAYAVQMWRQNRWAHNKGVVTVTPTRVRVFAFRESEVSGTSYRVVPPESIVEISDTAIVTPMDGEKPDSPMHRILVRGEGRTDLASHNRILAVQEYRTPEMDYFSPDALPYMKRLLDKYAAAGVKLNGLYADEMHIQQDWNYFGHHDNGEFAMRYVTPSLSRLYAERYGAEYSDLAKYMVYFAYGQEDWASNVTAKDGVMHVFGSSPEDIRRTALFRARYYRLLQDGVTDLFVDAKRYAEKLAGHRLESRAHATWAESPTIDRWRTGSDRMYRHAYEYTSNFVWSNTVHQAASACYDYFKWGDFLTGNGNDHAECGWLDRNYVGLALACSTGILNDVPYSYGAHWGMPDAVSHRRMALVNTFGAAGSPLWGLVQDMQHRDVDVLMLYPMDLVAVEERFGSWMAQYAYANLITQDKLLEMGRVDNGAVVVGGRRFTTLIAAFEPFPMPGLLPLMEQLAATGGRVIWSGPPPVLGRDGVPALETWGKLFGVSYRPEAEEGLMAPGRRVIFEGALGNLEPQTILTDLLIDHVYPTTPLEGVEVLARTQAGVVGTRRIFPGGGSAITLGFRPRDDQSGSLGYESRTWFEALLALGAYPGSGRWPDTNDNTEYLSRTTRYLFCRFPNGTVAVAPHLRDVPEDWDGGFARDAVRDAAAMKRVALPSEEIDLQGVRVHGHSVTYNGRWSMAFRMGARDGVSSQKPILLAFAGAHCDRITVDGQETVFADGPVDQIAWGPIPPERRVVPGAALQMMVHGTGQIRIPTTLTGPVRVYAEGARPGSRGPEVAATLEDGVLSIRMIPETRGRWLYAVQE